MINDNELAKLLNKRLYKDTNVNIEEDNILKEIQVENNTEYIEEEKTVDKKIYLNDIKKYLIFLFNVFAFGFATQTLLDKQWPIVGTLAIGYAISYILNKTFFLFSKY